LLAWSGLRRESFLRNHRFNDFSQIIGSSLKFPPTRRENRQRIFSGLESGKIKAKSGSPVIILGDWFVQKAGKGEKGNGWKKN
jgi:hypothetical protein